MYGSDVDALRTKIAQDLMIKKINQLTFKPTTSHSPLGTIVFIK